MATATTRADQVAQQVAGAGHGCSDLAQFQKSQFLLTFVKLGWPIPQYAGSCHVGGAEDLQIEVYRDAATVARRVSLRAARLCLQKGLPPYAYVTAGRVLLTPDQRKTAETLAPIVKGRASIEDCKG